MSFMDIIAVPFGYCIGWCYSFLNNYGLAIILFTLFTKIVLLPLSIWVQYNSIKMVKIQPAINWVRVKYFGNNDLIAEEESKMYKKEKYNPFATLIPFIIQIVILLGVVIAIYKPFIYILHLDPAVIANIENISSLHNGLNDNSLELAAIQNIQSGDIAPYLAAGIPQSVIDSIGTLNFSFLGLDLCTIPSMIISFLPVLAIGAPLVAGLSAWLLCVCQNKSNVLQAEQGKFNQYGLMIISVGLSLYLGFFVPLGIALYWVFSNIFAILQLYILNFFIPPKKYVDYEELEASRKELAKLKESSKQDKQTPEEKKKEKEDYKKFFSIANKHIVFYSESSGFYKYYVDIIEGLLKRTNVSIHYITNDYNDKIFELAKTEPRIKPYYIGIKKLINLFMKLECDVLLMTTPDLQNMYLKRSIMDKNVEYIYLPHESSSMFFGFKDHAFDHFDTIFSVGPHIDKEQRATEKLYDLKEKTLVPYGYPVIEHLCKDNEKYTKQSEGKKKILIAPSWQEDNVLDSSLDKLIEQLYSDEYKIIVRPHPEYMKRYKDRMDSIVEKYKDKIGDNLEFELDFSKNFSIYTSDLLITDWSSISLEFAFSTLKPVLFVNTKPKIENENWEALEIEPQDIRLRDVLGVSLDKSQLDKARETVKMLFDDNDFSSKIKNERETYYYNFGSNGKAGVDYLLKRLTTKKK